MNNIITLPKFIELLAQSSDRDQRFCERFVTEFTSLVCEGLATDGIVKIKGLGQFRLTNEAGKSKVEFVPDREVSDFINAPFLFFEPTVLSDDVNEDVLRGSNQRFDLSKEDTSFDHSATPSNQGPSTPLHDLPDDMFGSSANTQDALNDHGDNFTDPFSDSDPFGDSNPFSNSFDQRTSYAGRTHMTDDADFGDFGLNTPPSVQTTPMDNDPLNSDFDDIDSVLDRIDVSDLPVSDDQESKYGLSDTSVEKDTNGSNESKQGYTSRWSSAPSSDTESESTVSNATPERSDNHRYNNTSNNRNSKNPYDNYEYEEKPFPWLWMVVALLVGLGLGFAAGIFCHDRIIKPTVYQNTDEVNIIDNVYYDEIEEPKEETVTEGVPQELEPVREEAKAVVTPPAAPSKKATEVHSQQPVQTPNTDVNNAPASTNSNASVDRQDKKIIRNEPLPAEPNTNTNNTPAAPTASSGDVYDTITADCMISDLARKYYGNTAYWVYIYMENSDIISNPNNLRDGLRVKIPPKSKYDVSTNEEENIKAAKNKSRELFAKFK